MPRTDFRSRLIVMCGVCLSLLMVRAAAQNYRFDVWTTDDGLPQNTVNGLLQSRDRYIWFSTNDGIVRFDGVRFKVFNRANTPALPTNRYNNALEDRAGRLWFQTESNMVVKYEDGRFAVAEREPGVPLVINMGIFADLDGNLVVGTATGFVRFRDGRFEPFAIASAKPGTSISYVDSKGGFWIADPDGHLRRVLGDRIENYDLYDQPGFIPGWFYEDRFGKIWTRDADGRLNRLEAGRRQSFPIDLPYIYRFREDARGDFWIAVRNELYRIDAKDFTAGRIDPAAVHRSTIPEIAPDTVILSMLIDSEKGLWLGTDRSGLVHVTPQEVKVFSKTDWRTPDENVYPVVETRDRSVFLGVWERSLVKYAPDGKFSVYDLPGGMGLPTCLFEDSGRRIWVGNGSLFYLENGRFTSLPIDRDYDFKGFFVAQEDAAGTVWFGTNLGLARYRDGKLEYFEQLDGFSGEAVTSMIPARGRNGFWVGTTGGLAFVELAGEDAAPRVAGRYTAADGLAGNYVRSLYEEPDGTLWIGTYDSGLSRLKDGKLSSFRIENGMFSNNVFCILEDDNGWLWMNSNQGIYRVSKQNLNDFADGRTNYLTSIAYTKKDGLLSSEGNGGKQPAGIRRANGELWFPTLRGVAVIDPQNVSTNPLPPAVHLEEILIDRKEAENYGDRIVIEPGQSNLQINYTGLSFINSPLVKFRYRLEGLDENWFEAGTQRSAYYSYLPAGEYTFRVIAANRDGVWNDAGATVRVIVRPHFYQTWWFSALAALAVAAVVWLVYAARVAQLKKINEARTMFAEQLIESQERERKRIAAELHDGLGQTLAMIRNRAILAGEEPGDAALAEEQFGIITEQTGQAIGEVREIAYNLRPYLLDRLGLTKALRSLVVKTAEANKLEVVERIDDLDGLFQPKDEMSIYRIVQESLSNILKHAGARKIEVAVERGENFVRITIADDGKGFDAAAPLKRNANGGGFGLLSLTERVRMLGGTHTIESKIGKGTKIDIIIS
ncbi:MAG: hypothetical protein JSS81_22420 [Acidobacteria bacterium]|nr:hypothetical protein [Acidobacteriota bacterium]